MRNTILAAIALSAILLTAPGCAGNPVPSTIEISMRDYDEIVQNPQIQKQVEVLKGDEVLVTLLSNASTGFRWNENAVIADTGILQQLNHEDMGSGSNVPGAPGAEKWSFKALEAGTTTVHLEYGRPWEGGEKGVWTFDLTVTVK